MIDRYVDCLLYLGFVLDGYELEAFLATTGADAVIGFTKDVGWIASAAFELLVLQAFCERSTARGVKNWLDSNCSGLVQSLGMKFFSN